MLKKSRKNSPKAGVEAGLDAPAATHSSFARAVAEQDFSYGDADDEAAAEMGSTEETARYIADMIASLAFIAREGNSTCWAICSTWPASRLKCRRGRAKRRSTAINPPPGGFAT